MLKLHDYNKSSAAYRVRIALNIKQLDYEKININLLHAEHQQAEYLAINSQGLVPTLQDGEVVIHQSLAIIEYLEESYLGHALLPSDPLCKARVRALAYQVAMDVHPLNNLRVRRYLKNELNLAEEKDMLWYRHWISTGFKAIEKTLAEQNSNGKFCLGNTPTLADVCLIPQLYNAKRFDCNLNEFSLLRSIDEHCNGLTAFQLAHPDNVQE